MNDKFVQIDSIPYIDEKGHVIDHKNEEREEQMLVLKYLPRTAKVLELGARYGTVSCAISSVLEDPTQHIAVEPDTDVIQALEANRVSHGASFRIFNGVVSSKPMFLEKYGRNGYGSFTSVSDHPNTVSAPLESLSNVVPFDCLVADCEGFLEQFVRENPEFIKKLRVIIYETDRQTTCDYNYINSVILDAGLKCVYKGNDKYTRMVFLDDDTRRILLEHSGGLLGEEVEIHINSVHLV